MTLRHFQGDNANYLWESYNGSMIKHMKDLTEQEKLAFYESVKKSYEEQYHIPWSVIKAMIQQEIDDAFDDAKFAKLPADQQNDAAYARKEFGRNKPSMTDYLLWSVRFATHSDTVELPDA